MDIRNVGGTPGGTRTFALGLVMMLVGGYLLLDRVSVYGGYWNWGMGSGGKTFGITLIPLLFGIGILFANGRSFAGRLLTAAGAILILSGIIVNMDVHIQQTSLLNTLIVLTLLVGGIGLCVRAVMPMATAKDPAAADKPDEPPPAA